MPLKVWMFLLAMTLPDVSTNFLNETETTTEDITTTAESRVVHIQGSANDLCLAKLEQALGAISTNRLNTANLPMIDLTGYALHQPLKSIPVDMYVTDMRIKIPGNLQWAKVEKCRFDPNSKILQAKLLFRDLVVTASVKLLNEGNVKLGYADAVIDRCNMTLRLRQAGLGFMAVPQHVNDGAVGIKTSATFVDPNFVSIHAYNCQPIDGQDQMRSALVDGPEGRTPNNEDVSQEMEDIFLRGIRSLLTRYMEKQLQPALKDTLMMNLGYTISFGRK